ncbi:MAG: hypothetical protein WD154_03960 [Nitrosopumilaceae archaeon]
MKKTTRNQIIIGIVIFVVGSLVLSVVSPFMTPIINQIAPKQEGPDIKITNIQYSGIEPVVGRSADLKIYVFNDGTETANECRILFTDGTGQSGPKGSHLFGIRPNFDEQPIIITTGIYESAGDYELDTYVTCDNYESSQHYKRTIVVTP